MKDRQEIRVACSQHVYANERIGFMLTAQLRRRYPFLFSLFTCQMIVAVHMLNE